MLMHISVLFCRTIGNFLFRYLSAITFCACGHRQYQTGLSTHIGFCRMVASTSFLSMTNLRSWSVHGLVRLQRDLRQEPGSPVRAWVQARRQVFSVFPLANCSTAPCR